MLDRLVLGLWKVLQELIMSYSYDLPRYGRLDVERLW